MSRSLSARCLHRTVFSLPPSPAHAVPRPPPGGRQYGYAALKTQPQSDRSYPRRQENPPPYSRAVPHEPGVRLQADYLREQSDTPRTREPPPSDRESQPPYADEESYSPRESGSRVGAGTRDHGQWRSEGSRETAHRQTGFDSHAMPPPAPVVRPREILAEHLSGLFPPLKFPLEISTRILTHASHPAALAQGHNAQFSFIGRRVLETYLLLLLASSPHLKPTHDLQEIVSNILNTYFLGEHVGSQWGLGRIMRWTPNYGAVDETGTDQKKLLNSGLYKVQGDAVAAVIGGIFQQFGGSVAHRVFHTRLLPRLLQPKGGLPVCFHADAVEACTRLGGTHGPLVLDSETSARQEQKPEALSSAPKPNRQPLRR